MSGGYRLNSEKVKSRMLELDMTLPKLAAKSELSYQTVYKAVNKDTGITGTTAEKIAKALEIAFDEFVDEGYAVECQWGNGKNASNDVCKNEAQKELISVFKTNLRARQRYCGISREELAKRSNVSLREIGKLMNGHVNPRISTVYSVAKSLGVSIDDLLTDGYDKTLIE